jgi:hypothetical protein
MRREFPLPVRRAIILRASEHGVPHCEECGQSCPAPDLYQIDHKVAEGHEPSRLKPLTKADGRLLCLHCHKGKTARDVFAIAKGTRIKGKHRTVAQASGPTGIARRFGIKQEGPK